MIFHSPPLPIIAGHIQGGVRIVEIDMDFDGQIDLHFASSLFITGFIAHGTNRVSSLLNADVGGIVTPVLPGEMIGATSLFVRSEWHRTSENLEGIPWLFGFDIGQCADMSGCGGVMQFTDGLIALEFQRSTGTHFGWLHFIGHSAADPTTGSHGGRVTEWAWESEPGAPIIAGTVPESSVAILGAGATMFLFRRTRVL